MIDQFIPGRLTAPLRLGIAYDQGPLAWHHLSEDTAVSQNDLYITLKRSEASQAIRLDVKLHAGKPVTLQKLMLRVPLQIYGNDQFYLNGFQSWSDSPVVKSNSSLGGLKKPFFPVNSYFRFEKYGDSYFYHRNKKPGKFHSHFYCLQQRGSEHLLLASTNETSGYTIFQYHMDEGYVDIIRDCEGVHISEAYDALNLFFDCGPLCEVFKHWAKHFHKTRRSGDGRNGWTSWYYHYTNISEDIIVENLQAFSRLQIPLDIFQIDDGYQTAVGDWLEIRKNFPSGMKALAERIHATGYEAGLWLAPFVCEQKSTLFKNHPDWLLRDHQQRPLVAGRNPGWSGLFYALNPFHREVQAYLRTVFQTVLQDWHYDMVKLDFLYAAALMPPEGMTRGMVMEQVMQMLRQWVGEDRKILGCGVPLAAAAGHTDYCRIGPDVGLEWEDPRLALLDYPERISTKVALQNTLSRHMLNRRLFINDPDVFILRDNVNLNTTQRESLFRLNLALGDLLFTSDNPAEYDADTLRLYCSQFPRRHRHIEAIGEQKELWTVQCRSGDHTYLLLANLADVPRDLALPRGTWWQQGNLISDRLTLDPFASLCLLKVSPAGFLGSTGHLFPGMEFDDLAIHRESIRYTISSQVMVNCEFFFRIDPNLQGVIVNGIFTAAEKWNGFQIVRCHYYPKAGPFAKP